MVKNDVKSKIKNLPLADKLLYGGSLLTIVGSFAPVVVAIKANMLSIPYGWLFLLLAIAVPGISFFVDAKWKRDATLMVSEALAITVLVGTFGFYKVSSYGSVGFFDVIGAGAILLIIGTIATTIGAYLNE